MPRVAEVMAIHVGAYWPDNGRYLSRGRLSEAPDGRVPQQRAAGRAGLVPVARPALLQVTCLVSASAGPMRHRSETTRSSNFRYQLVWCCVTDHGKNELYRPASMRVSPAERPTLAACSWLSRTSSAKRQIAELVTLGSFYYRHSARDRDRASAVVLRARKTHTNPSPNYARAHDLLHVPCP